MTSSRELARAYDDVQFDATQMCLITAQKGSQMSWARRVVDGKAQSRVGQFRKNSTLGALTVCGNAISVGHQEPGSRFAPGSTRLEIPLRIIKLAEPVSVDQFSITRAPALL